MRDWRYYWNHADQVFGDEPLRQVGKTVSGQTIEPAVLGAIVADIVLRLDLGGSDSVLDLCCGNGLITSRIAEHTKSMGSLVEDHAPVLRVHRAQCQEE